MRTSYIPFLALVASAVMAGPTTAAETLQQAVGAAIERFPEIQAARYRGEAARAQIGQAKAELFPSVNGSLGEGRETSRNVTTRFLGNDVTLTRREAEVSITQLLFDGGAAGSQVKRFSARAEGADANLASTIQEVALRAAQAFLDVSRLREQLAIAREAIGIHERTLSDVSALAEAGRGRRADVTQAEARRSLAVSSAEQISGQLAQAESAFRHFIGRPPGQLAPAPSLQSELLPRADEAVKQAITSHPAVRAAEKEVEAAQHDRESARARLAVPRLTVEAGASRNRDIDGIAGPNEDRYAMLRLRYNFFRGFGDSERVRETEARMEEALAVLTRVRTEVERDVLQAWDALASDRVRLPQLAQYARASSDVAEAYRLQFQLGQRSLLDVLNAENERYNAISAYVGGRITVATDELRLLASQGRLVEALGVPVPEMAGPSNTGVSGGGEGPKNCDNVAGTSNQCLVLQLDARLPEGRGLDAPLSNGMR